jgi:6-phosphogluconolactonase
MSDHREFLGTPCIAFIAFPAACLFVAGSLTGCSSSSSPSTTPGVVNFVYTANAASTPSTVSALASDATTGKLTSISGSPYNTGSASAAVQADPAGKFLYVANRVSGDISGFTITATTGALTPMAAPFSVEFGVDAIAIDPSGKFLYAVSAQSNNLWSFSIDNAGALTNLSSSPLTIDPAASSSTAIAIDPSGNYLFTVAGSNSIYSFPRDTTTGALGTVSGSPVPVDFGTFAITTDPAGKFVIAVSNAGSTVFGTISVYSLDSTTGKLALVAGSQPHIGVDPSSVVVDPSGKYVYTANTADATLSALTLNPSTGALTTISGSPFPSGGNGTINGPIGLVVDPSGQSVYVCSASNDISVFKISSGGGLSVIAGSPFPIDGNGPNGIAVIQKK